MNLLRATVCFLALLPHLLMADEILVLALDGDPAPDGKGTLADSTIKALAEGVAVFCADTQGGPEGDGERYIVATTSKDGTKLIYRSGDAAPVDGKMSILLSQVSVNSKGQSAFCSYLNDTLLGTGHPLEGGGEFVGDDQGLFLGGGSSLIQIARSSQHEPQGGPGVFSSLGNVSINLAGKVAFGASISNAGTPLFNTQGIYLAHEGTLTQIARTYTAAPDGLGTFNSVNQPSLSNTGWVKFTATLGGPGVQDNNETAFFLGNGSHTTLIARENDPVPDGNGRLGTLYGGVLNENNTIAFFNSMTGTRGGRDDMEGIFKASGGPLGKIVRAGDAAPDADGVFSSLTNTLSINKWEEVSFTALLRDASPGREQGVFFGDGSRVVTVARSGDIPPEGGDIFSKFGLAVINNTHTVVFQTELSSGKRAIYMGDGTETILVARAGDTLMGVPIVWLGFSPQNFNDFRQLAFGVVLEDGRWGALLFCPTIKWRKNGNGDWNNQNRWTVSLRPAGYSRVEIDPPQGGIITGPDEATSIRSLDLGKTSADTSELNLQPAGELTVLEGMEIGNSGKLTGNGKIVGDVTNKGKISPGNSPGKIEIAGKYTQPSGGHLVLELGGVAAELHDQLLATGDVQLGGTLEIVLLNGFTPRLGDKFTLISTGGALNGSFGNFLAPRVPGIKWEVTQTATELVLTAVTVNGNIDDFRENYGLTDSGADDRSNWSGNGIFTIEYFLMGLGDPTRRDVRPLVLNASLEGVSPGLPILTPRAGGGFVFSSIRHKTQTEYFYITEVSGDMLNWSDVSNGATDYRPTGMSITSMDDQYEVLNQFFDLRSQPTFFRVRLGP